MVNEWLNAELSDDTPVTAELRQLFKQFRDDYGNRSDTELDYRTSVLADAVYALEVSSIRARETLNPNRNPAQKSSRKDTQVSEKWS